MLSPVETAGAPAGPKIVFISLRDGDNEIYVISVDGSGVTNLTSFPDDDYDPVCSPDGSRMAFRSDRERDGIPNLEEPDTSVD